MKKIELEIMRKVGCEDIPLPKYMSRYASGMDLYAAVPELEILNPGEIKLVPTGIFISLPVGYEAQVRPRSGLALKKQIGILNSPGTIDGDYRGEIGVILYNVGKECFEIKRGMRVAQMVIQPVVQAELVEVTELDSTIRGKGGFGHTGH